MFYWVVGFNLNLAQDYPGLQFLIQLPKLNFFPDSEWGAKLRVKETWGRGILKN